MQDDATGLQCIPPAARPVSCATMGLSRSNGRPNAPTSTPSRTSYLWFVLKAKLQKKFPHMSTLPGGPAAVKDTLEGFLEQAWAEIGEDLLEKYVSCQGSATISSSQLWNFVYRCCTYFLTPIRRRVVRIVLAEPEPLLRANALLEVR